MKKASLKKYLISKENQFRDACQEFVEHYDEDFNNVIECLHEECEKSDCYFEYDFLAGKIIEVQAFNAPTTNVKMIVTYKMIFEFHTFFLDLDNEEQEIVEKKVSTMYVVASSDLADDFEEINILGIYPEMPENLNRLSFTDELVPIIRKDDYPDLAQRLAEKYNPDALKAKTPINVEQFAENAGLHLVYADLERNGLIGKIFFEDTDLVGYENPYAYIFEDGEKAHVIAGTAVISSSFPDPIFDSTTRTTIMHETVHWLLHRKAMTLRKLQFGNANSLSCDLNRQHKTNRTALDWIEFQANRLAPMILTAIDPFDEKHQEFWEKNSSLAEYADNTLEDRGLQTLHDLSKFYGCSVSAARVMAIKNGYPYEGCGVYLDNRYVPTFNSTPNDKPLEWGETYAISTEQFLQMLEEDDDLAKAFFSGKLSFVENHAVLNRSGIIIRENGELRLTTLARSRLPEIVVRFKTVNDNKVTHKAHGDYTFDRQLDQHFVDPVAVVDDRLQQLTAGEAFKLSCDDLDELLNGIDYDNPGNFLKQCMKWAEETQESLADKTGFTKDQISRYCRNKVKNINRDFLLACGVAMRLPQEAILELLISFGVPLNTKNSQHRLIKRALLYSQSGLKTFNECLQICGIQAVYGDNYQFV